MRQRKILRVDEVHGDLGVRRVLHPDVPQPRGAFLGEHQREGDAEPEPLAGRPQPRGIEPGRELTTCLLQDINDLSRLLNPNHLRVSVALQ